MKTIQARAVRTGTRRIVVSLDLAQQSGRDHLAGIYRFADSRRQWSITVIPCVDAAYRPVLGQLLDAPFDGAIVKGEMMSALVPTLRSTHIPAVAIDAPDSPESLSFATRIVKSDNASIGRTAAEYFAGLGRFASYAAIPFDGNSDWAVDRVASFARCIRTILKERVTLPPVAYGVGGDVGTSGLAKWLRTLPRPVAAFVPFDLLAVRIINACREARLRIPRDVSVLGVDNDALICEHTHPRLTSIQPDHEGQGFRAAETLDRLLREKAGRRDGTGVSTCRPKGVVERESTGFTSPAAQLVRTAQAIVRDHALEGIRAADVVSRLGVSMRLANLRFRESLGHSIREALVRRRLEEVCRLLDTTPDPVSRIARRCGFASPVALTHLFMRRYGQSPTAFRATVQGFKGSSV